MKFKVKTVTNQDWSVSTTTGHEGDPAFRAPREVASVEEIAALSEYSKILPGRGDRNDFVFHGGIVSVVCAGWVD